MKEENFCTYKYINSNTDINEKCRILTIDCEFSYFNLIKLNFCTFNDLKVVTIIFAILITTFCFYFVANTANKYLAPMLGTISEKLHLSQNLAGLTLLALGNQAPDVLVVIISGDDEQEGISMAFGAVLGGALIILHIVLSSVVLLGNDFEVTPSNYVRDFSVYLFSLIIVSIFGAFKKIFLWESILFFLIYSVYVVLCFFMDKKGKKKYMEEETLNLIENVSSRDQNVILFNNDICVVSEKELNLNDSVDESYLTKKTKQRTTRKLDLKFESTIFARFQFGVVQNYLKWPETSWSEKNTFQKIIYCAFEFPLDVLRDLTIPPFENQRWNRPMFIVMPFTIPLLCIGIFRIETLIIYYWPYAIGFFVIMGILSIIAIRTTYRNALPKCEWFLLILGCFVTLGWLWGISNVLLDMVKVIKMLIPLELPQAFFTMTLVSIGNALPDFFNNCTLARKGYAEMAYSGSIGSPVFGILFGFGVSLIKQNLSQYPTPLAFDIYDLSIQSNQILLAGLGCLIINISRLLIEGFIMRFKIKKCSSYIGYLFYAIFIGCICYFAFD